MSEPQRQSVTLTREYDAPIELVWAAWTDRTQVSRWMKCDANVKLTCDAWEPATGAKFQTTMEMPGQWTAVGTGTFTEVDPPNVLAYASDPDEKTGMPSMSLRVELEALGENRTRLTLTHSGIPGDEMRGIIEGGWTNSLGMLDELVTVRS